MPSAGFQAQELGREGRGGERKAVGGALNLPLGSHPASASPGLVPASVRRDGPVDSEGMSMKPWERSLCSGHGVCFPFLFSGDALGRPEP